MEKSWIVYGPQGSGKTLHRHAIAKALGLRFILDEWDEREDTFEPHNTLHLAHSLPEWARNNRRVLSIGMALAKVRAEYRHGAGEGARQPARGRASVTGFSVVRTLTVRREFSAGPEVGSVSVQRDCGLGCTCGATIYKTAGASARLAEAKTLCFNDRTKEGISEIAGSARLVPSSHGVTAYEVQAHLKRHNDELTG